MAKNKSIVWKIVTKKLSELKLYEKNPRTITEQGLKDLKKSIDKFGLAEPIIINTDNTIIGGHARYLTIKANKVKECQCYIPNRKLNDKEVEELNVRLNKNVAGFFDFDILANQFEMDDLLEWGFTEKELTGIDDLKEGEEIELPQSVQLVPPKEYILIMCEPNSVEWEELKEKLKLKRVRRGGYKKGSAFDDIDLERVLTYKDFKKRFENVNSNTK